MDSSTLTAVAFGIFILGALIYTIILLGLLVLLASLGLVLYAQIMR